MKNRKGSFKTELAYFKEIWDEREFYAVEHSSEKWDKRAAHWIDEIEHGGDNVIFERVDKVSNYLRQRGLLSKEDTAADVGCGPGLFVKEFAKTAGNVTGFDFCDTFIKYGEKITENQSNSSFELCDIFSLKTDEIRENFDLVFTSLTPAVKDSQTLEKIMKMSRKMCCNISFVHTTDNLRNDVSKNVFDGKTTLRKDGTGFYVLFNYLLLSGYCPETFYFTIERKEVVIPNRKTAEDISFSLNIRNEEDISRVEKYLEKTGETERHTVTCYGSILWDKNKIVA